MKYYIEHHIQTLVDNAVMHEKDDPASFSAKGIVFTHRDFNMRDGWVGEYWVAKAEVEAENLIDAITKFKRDLALILPRVAFVGQSYTEASQQSFLVRRIDAQVAYVRCVEQRQAVGLMFMEKERKALELLLHADAPDEFFYYWNEATNVVSYSAKLLLLFSALEALTKKTGATRWATLEAILGAELKEKLFGTSRDFRNALRNRLVHGEYFNASDFDENYVELIHKRVVKHFNKEILGAPLITEEVVHPQRHILGSKEEWRLFVRPRPRSKTWDEITLKSIVDDSITNGVNNLQTVEPVYNETTLDQY